MPIFKKNLIIFIGTILTGFVASPAIADWDLAVGGYARSYPLGGSVELNAGYGTLLWGAVSSPWYGYARFGGEVAGVEDYVSTGLRAELFPISFLGAKIGASRVQNYVEYEDFDCANSLCRGEYSETFIEVPLYWQFGRLQGLVSYFKSEWEVRNGLGPGSTAEFIEPLSGLPVGIADRNSTFAIGVERWRGVGFWRLTDLWQVGYAQTHYSSCLRESSLNCESQIWQGLVQLRWQRVFSIAAGAGEYKSRFGMSDPAFTLFVSYSPLPKLGY